MITRTPVTSSNIKSIGYSETAKTLVVEFSSGQVYQYAGVKPEVYQELMAAPSIGAYFARTIKAFPELHAFAKLEPEDATPAPSAPPKAGEIRDLRALRLTYRQAIAASDAAALAYHQQPTTYSAHLDRLYAMEARYADETSAGRAFMAALDQQDPACRSCGCTLNDPCEEGCWWVPVKPGEDALCSVCAAP